MCGIAGAWGNSVGSLSSVQRMCATLIHRGPDGDGFWSDEDAKLVFGHRRLAVIDLTEQGRQPMVSHDGRYCITYNGELYNSEDLRGPLIERGINFHGTSDTEVLVNAIATSGIEPVLQQINGIYAFAVWDRKQRTLHLVRDRLGVKPLFYAEIGDSIAFASEVHALATLDGFDNTIDGAAVGCFLQYNSIHAPLSIYRGARALEAGTVLTLSASGQAESRRYWTLADAVTKKPMHGPDKLSDQDAVYGLETLLEDSVRRQLVSDVPIGCFLSGGIDSSLVATLMQKARSQPIKTFSIGFNDPKLDEAQHARRVAETLGTEHHELYVSENDALDAIPEVASNGEQPFADASILPTYLLCRMAREHVTVALSGDGGDEMFFGYSRYQKARRARRALGLVPQHIRRAMSQLIHLIGSEDFSTTGFLGHGRLARAGWHASRLLNFTSHDVNDAYLNFITHWAKPELLAPSAIKGSAHWQQSKSVTGDFDTLMMMHDATTYMPEQVLTKVDRASMLVSLEARVPLLDHRIVEYAWHLPQDMKYRQGISKWGLRQVLYKHVPRELVDRPKSGFGPPLGKWLRGPLRDWGEELLSERCLSDLGLFTPAIIRRFWKAHQTGQIDASSLLWSVLMLQSWLKSRGSSGPHLPRDIGNHSAA